MHLDRNFRVHKYLSGVTGGRIDKTREIRETKGAARGVSPFNKPELNMANERPQFRYASLVIRAPLVFRFTGSYCNQVNWGPFFFIWKKTRSNVKSVYYMYTDKMVKNN